jgi:ubiquinone/menaquinone biosynthesis C-methylase UbiE
VRAWIVKGEDMATDYEWSDATGFARLFEDFFVPALFADWAELTVAAGSIEEGDKVLDVACGTGIVARAARRLTDHVVGIDISEDMLSVASEIEPSVDWKHGDAQNLPFEDGAFDVVFCQFGFMFFPDKIGALREMKRVGGKVVVTVWDALERTPGYREFVELLSAEFGQESADILSSPFSLGDKELVAGMFREAGLKPIIETDATVARFPSMEAWITTDIRATPMSAMFDDVALAKLIKMAKQALAEYENKDGTISFSAPAHIITA